MLGAYDPDPRAPVSWERLKSPPGARMSRPRGMPDPQMRKLRHGSTTRKRERRCQAALVDGRMIVGPRGGDGLGQGLGVRAAGRIAFIVL